MAWVDYAEYCNDVYDREYGWEDPEISYERKKELNALEDMKDNMLSLLEELTHSDVSGRDRLVDSLFNLCDLLHIDATILHDKLANVDEVA